MARMTDQELVELKARAITAMGSGSIIGNANNYLVELVSEVQELRKAGQVKPSLPGKLLVGEMEVKKVALAEGPKDLQVKVASQIEAHAQVEASVSEETPAPVTSPSPKKGKRR